MDKSFTRRKLIGVSLTVLLLITGCVENPDEEQDNDHQNEEVLRGEN